MSERFGKWTDWGDSRAGMAGLVIVVIYLTIQSFAVGAPIFPADDGAEYAFVRGMDSIWGLFGSDVFGLFRPVKNMLFCLFAEVIGDVKASRLLCLALGVGSFFCVQALCRRIFGRSWKAVGVAAVWFLAPTLVSSTAWLSCVNIQVMCGLAALVVLFHDQGGTRSRVCAGLLLFLALVSYENAVALGPIVAAFDLFLRPGRWRRRSTWMVYCGYALVTVAYLVLRFHVGSGTSVSGSFDAVSRAEISAASAYFTFVHFLSWTWPFGRFTVFGAYCHGDVGPWTLGLCWIGLVLAGVFSVCCRKRFPVASLGMAIALIGFLPVSNLLGFGNGPYGDYYLGLSSIGLSILLVESADLGFSRKGALRYPGLALGIGLVVLRLAAIGESMHWATLWGNGALAYAESTKNFPLAYSNRLKLAEFFCNAGNYDLALGECDAVERRLQRGSSQLMESYQVRALVAMNRDRDAVAAMRYLELAKEVARPGVFEANYHHFRGCVLEDLLDDGKAAMLEYRKALAMGFNVDSVDAANRLARLLALDGDLGQAVALWERAHRIRPDDALVAANLRRARLRE